MNEQKLEDMTWEEQAKERSSWVTAVIEKAQFMVEDHSGYCLSLSFDMDGRAFFQFFQDLKVIGEMIEAAKVAKPEDLVGHVCYVKESDGYWRFIKVWR